MRNLKNILEELDIRYTMPVQPVLLPGPPPGLPGSSKDSSPVKLHPAPARRAASDDSLGNSGGLQISRPFAKPPGGSFRSEVDTF